MSLLTPLNVSCHASDGRKVTSHFSALTFKSQVLVPVTVTPPLTDRLLVVSVNAVTLGGRIQPRADGQALTAARC